jgi:hypothetical protein
LGSELDEMFKDGWSTADNFRDNRGLTQSPPNTQGVRDVFIHGVIRREHRRDSTLGIAGV